MRSWIVTLIIFTFCGIQNIEGWISSPCHLPGSLVYAINCFAETQVENHLELVRVTAPSECGCTIDELDLYFNMLDTLDEKASRQFAVTIVNDLLVELNKNEKISSLFTTFPLTLNEVMIQIQMKDLNCEYIYPRLGNIASITIEDQRIIYGTMNSYTYQIDTLRTETIVQAEQLINWQTSSQ